jgi:ABC-2 type transport system permease protein
MPRFISKLDTIIAREYFERVRSRWFLIATLIGPVFMAFMLFLPSFLELRARKAEAGTVRVIDATPDSVGRLVVSALQGGIMGDTARAQFARAASPTAMTAERDRATRDVLSGSLVGYLEIEPGALGRGVVRYSGRNTTALLAMQQLERTLNRAVLSRQLEASGIDADRSAMLAGQQVRVETERLTERGRGGSGQIGVAFALGIAITLYLTIFMHGANVMRGVLEEKQTRVAEVVLSSVPSDALLMGKVIGIGAVGFTQLLIWLAVATTLLFARAPILAKFGIAAAGFSLPELSVGMGLVILFSFVLGFLFYAALFAMVGAVVSSEQDAQQAQLPVVLLLAISLGSVQGILTSPEGTMARLLTVVPFSSPIILPLRLSLAPIAMREIVISLVVLALSALGMTFVASRLYRVGVLMYGKRPSLREVWRWMWIR